MLQKFGIRASKEETDRVDTFRYSFVKLLNQAVSNAKESSILLKFKTLIFLAQV